MACFAGFLTGREAARAMLTRERGAILFTGATASTRGAKGFAAFSGAKHGLRALAQSMARELGPKNIHVAHIVIDGAIDTGFIAVGSAKDGLQVVAKMKETPAEDPVFGRSAVRADGRVIHDSYLFEVKSPAESKGAVGLLQADLDHAGG